MKSKGIDVADMPSVKPEYEEDPYKKSVESLPVKGKKKWRIW